MTSAQLTHRVDDYAIKVHEQAIVAGPYVRQVRSAATTPMTHAKAAVTKITYRPIHRKRCTVAPSRLRGSE